MDDISKLRAPKKMKLTKPRPRTKDVNQNNIPSKLLNPEDFCITTSPNHLLLQEENYDLRGETLDLLTYPTECGNSASLPNGNVTNVQKLEQDTVDSKDDNNGNFYNNDSRRDSETSSVCSSLDDINMNTYFSDDSVSKMRAPRKVKLTKPRPLKCIKPDQNGNKENERTDNSDTDITIKITALMEQLKQGTLSVNDCLHLRDLLAVHCPHLEMINKEYIDCCFKHIEEVLQEKNQDKLVLISLRDLIALRKRAWEPFPKPSSTRKKSITWNDISEEISYKESMLYDTYLPLVQTQMSMDSGIGLEDQALLDNEEAYEEDIAKEILSDFCSKERSPSPNSVIEAVKGLKIVGENEEIVKTAVELIQKYLNDGKQVENDSSKPVSIRCKEELKNNVIRQPIGPGTSIKLIQEVEKTLPGGMHTAKGRRAMFKTYNTAVSVTHDDKPEMNICPQHYERDQLLYFSSSPLSKNCPSEMSYLSKVFPDVCLIEVRKFFSKKDLPIKDYSWSCPVKGVRQDNYSSENNTRFDGDKAPFVPQTLRRGFSCPSGDSDAEFKSSRDGFCNGQRNRSDFGKQTLKRGFSLPAGEAGNEKRGFGRPSSESDSDDSTISRTGLICDAKHYSPFADKELDLNETVEKSQNGFGRERKGFGSPNDKQGFGSPSENKGCPFLKGNGFHVNKTIVRKSSLPAVDNTEEQWD